MKKVLYLSISINLLLALVFGVVFVQQKGWNEFLASYQEVSVNLDSISDGSFKIEELYEDLQVFSEAYQVNVLQFQFSDMDVLDIFSTNIKFDKNFIMYQGNHPQEHLFLSTEEEVSGNQMDILNFPWSNITIRVFDLPQARNTGLWGDFKLSGDLEQSMIFAEYFSKYGEVSVQTTDISQLMLILNSIDQSLLITLTFSTLISFSVIFLSILRSRKRIFIDFLWGNPKGATLLHFPKEIGKLQLQIMLIYLIFISLYLIFENQTLFFALYLKTFFTIQVLLFLLFSLFALLCTVFIFKVYNIAESIKNKNFIRKITFFAFFTKSVLNVLMIYLVISTLFNFQVLRKELDGFDYWSQTENIFKTSFHYDTRLNDSDLNYDRDMNNRFADFYRQTQVENGAFIMFSENFHPLSYNEDGNPLFDHHLNCLPEEFFYIYCNAIIIDEAYLSRQTIITPQEEDVLDLIVQDDSTLNILVPITYQYSENEIRDFYLNYFYIQKFEILNFYLENLNEPLVETTKEGLSVNIIYTDHHQNYFTYKPYTGGFENMIEDPIAVVFTDNLDPSLISAIMTSSLFFVDGTENQAYDSLANAKEKNELVELRSVQSVYRHKSELINQAQVRLIQQAASLTIILGVIAFLQIFMVWGFYQFYSYKLTLQRLFGFNFFKIHGKLLMFLLLGYLPIGLVNYLIQNLNELRHWQLSRLFYLVLGAPLHLDLSVSWVIRGTAVFILLEFLLIFAIGRQQMKSNIEKTMKGDYV